MSLGIAHTPLLAVADFFPTLGSQPTLGFLDKFKWTGLANLPPLWAVGAAGAFVLLLYILRLRRRQVEVPFSRLWARVLRDREPNTFWRRFKRFLSLLLQVLVLSLLLGAVADPRDKTELKKGRHLLVLIDTSASMQARDAPPMRGEEAKGPRTRIDVAREEVRQLLINKRRNDYVMLVRMDGQVTPVTSWTRDLAVLEKKLNKMKAAETAADIGRGLRFATDTLRGLNEPILVLVGDGQYENDQLRCVFWGSSAPKDWNCELDDPSRATPAPGARPKPGMRPAGMDAMRPAGMRPAGMDAMRPAAMRPATMRPAAMRPARGGLARGGMARGGMKPDVEERLKAPRPEVVAAERFIDPIAMGKIKAYAISVGESQKNIGIIDFNVRRNPADKFSHQLFVKVRNYNAAPVKVNLLVYTGAVLPETVHLEIPGKTVRQYIKKGLPAAGKRIRGKLIALSGGKLDDFPLDDEAFALLPKRSKTKVLLVSPGNLFIEGILLLDRENIAYKRIMPSAWTKALAEKYDAVIFDDFTPPTLPRTGNFLMFDPRGPGCPFTIKKRVKDPEIWWPSSDKDKRHPVMDFIRVKDLRTVESSVFQLDRRDVPLMRLDERGPVYAALRREPGRRVVAVGFSSRQTNWVVRIGFPVFILNTISYFAGDNLRLIHTYRTGESWSIPLEVASDLVTIKDPKGKEWKAPLRDGRVSFYGRHIGFHVITPPGGKVLEIASNLANPRESDISPVAKIVLGAGTMAQELKRPDLKAELLKATISTRTVLLTVLLAGIGLVLLAFGLWGGRAGPLWVFFGILLISSAVLVVSFAMDVRPWTAILLAVTAILVAEWLTYNRRVTV